jgi:long-chain acyl-CoA synthetase
VSSGSARPPAGTGQWALGETLAGRNLVVIGGTGFLGKVFWIMLLAKFPNIGKLHLVVRARRGQDAETRFWSEIATADCLAVLRAQHGDNYESFLREKVEVVEGDIVQLYCGVDARHRDAWRGNIHALINASGIVDFQPPLDIALEVNAFGVQSLVALSRDLGDVPMIHTSTCYVAGYKTGIVEETNPLDHPFPYAGKLERAHWDPDREIDECLDIIRQARHRAGDAFRQSHFLDQAKQNLTAQGEPVRGKVLETEIERVRRKFIEAQLAELGQERAQFWGWANTYTYTKSIGEQIVAGSGLPFAIVRPAIIESCVEFPERGWNEGVNTSAPLIFAIREGQFQLPGSGIRLDIVPCDMVATGMLLALGELIRGEQKPVYQFGTSDTNPTTMARIFELSGLYKRKYYRRTGRGGPLGSFVQGHIEGAMLSPAAFDRVGPKKLAAGALGLAGWLKRASTGPLAPMLEPTIVSLNKLASAQQKVYSIVKQFEPFVATLDYEFRCDNTRDAWARLDPADKQLLIWSPESLDWREWFLETHMPGLEKWVFPHMEKRLRKPIRPLKKYETLADLLSQMAERYDLAPALSRTEADGLTRITFREWHERARACGQRLKDLGVAPGDRVLLAAKNHPEWPIALFGICMAGATAVPLDAEIDARSAEVLKTASGARVALLDDSARQRLAAKLGEGVAIRTLSAVTAAGPAGELAGAKEEDIALLIYTSGTTGKPKGVMLSHGNLCSILGSLAPLFPLGRRDRVLSVLPLHHTFELTCGMLLPLSRGSRIVYLDELNAERLTHAMKAGRITAMIGVPALWEMLERRILSRVSERGPVASRVFDIALEVSRAVGKSTGVDVGRLLFGSVHSELGGHLRFLVSGGAALGESTHSLFAALGLPLTEGYGLTEAAPVLSVAKGGPRAKAKQVGRAIPEVEIKIDGPNADGVGEVFARGPNVMVGYSDDPEATAAVLDAEGWLHTGDLGKLDHRGRLSIVGRAKDVIVASNGENVYPDDVEARLGLPDAIVELAVLGVDDDRGGERVACAAVVDPELPREVAHARARHALQSAILDLPSAMRPTVVSLLDTQLPRTSTRKVKRKELRDLVLRLQPRPSKEAVATATHVRRILGTLTRRDPKTISPSLTLRGDLGCDSLLLLELLVALEAQLGRTVDAEQLASCQTVGEAEALMAQLALRPTAKIEAEPTGTPLVVPEPLQRAAMHWMGRAQSSFYSQVMHTVVTGRAFIPQNRNVLVIANHASHLDMGLIKHALGDYSKDMVSLAAQDYFFEGKLKKAYFENFSNLVPVSRTGSLRQLLRTAGDLLAQGKVVLLFPEGTRSVDGALREFKPALGYLALQSRVDILPLWLEGAYRALPKGATMIRNRRLEARIGPPLSHETLLEITKGMSSRDASRSVAELAHRAVSALSRGQAFDLERVKSEPPKDEAQLKESGARRSSANGGSPEVGLAGVFERLQGQFVPGSTNQALSYYFSLGSEKWTLRASRDSCEVARGKPTDRADCVLKTSPELFRRIVDDAYTPSAAEFMSGAVRSNNVQLLMTFQKIFKLKEQAKRS